MRGGRECLVTNTDVVVGDVLLLDTGDRVVADGIAVEAHGLTIDEARALALAQRARACAHHAEEGLGHAPSTRHWVHGFNGVPCPMKLPMIPPSLTTEVRTLEKAPP